MIDAERILFPPPVLNTYDTEYGARVRLYTSYVNALEALAFAQDENAQRRHWTRIQALEDEVEKPLRFPFRAASQAEIAVAEERLRAAEQAIAEYPQEVGDSRR